MDKRGEHYEHLRQTNTQKSTVIKIEDSSSSCESTEAQQVYDNWISNAISTLSSIYPLDTTSS